VRICVLHSAESPTDTDRSVDPSPWLPEHVCEYHLLQKATAARDVRDLVKRGRFDVFINLCDGAWDEDRAGIEVVQALERLGVAFTGANSAFFEPSRAAMKLVCHQSGVATPNFMFAPDLASAALAADTLRFPLIVKHPNSYASVGMTRDSRVGDRDQLLTQAARLIDEFGGVLIEEFIAGREFTVLIAENHEDPRRPIAFVPSELRFPPGETFKHHDLKWVDYATMTWEPVRDAALAARLQDMSRKQFLGLGGCGYGRCDIRMDQDGRLFMLEINANCGIFYPPSDPGSADVILANDPAGHRGFLDMILAAAFARQRARARPWALRYVEGEGYGLYATRDIARGEAIEVHEERPVQLVTRRHIERNWDAERRRCIGEYAYPISDEVWAMWSDNPDEWKPINHSCDPNAWFDGLNLAARRPIARGAQITLDYATFVTDGLESFTCRCAAADCRGTIGGDDHLLPFIDERYGEHISDHVRRRRLDHARRAPHLSPKRRAAGDP
jgi:D-alanine-D-alanine ligase-like ATP-grasp enzyme